MKLRLGTRGSDLALWQARHIAALLAPEAEVELVVLQTQGDRIDDRPLTEVAGKAFFTAEIERALLDGAVDLAVHSHKDLPTESPPGLVVVAVPPRGPAQERLLVSAAAWAPDALFLPLAHGASVGTSSPRREQLLRALRPDLVVAGLRGNVPTRVRRLQEGRYGAILLAAAGLTRLQLDLSGLHVVDLPPELLVPAPAQGALAVQIRAPSGPAARAGDAALAELCARRLHDADTAARIGAERTLLSLAGGGCSLPLGAHVVRLGGSSADTAGAAGGAAGRPRGAWRVHAFLGADQPRAGSAARWAVADGESPAAAVRAALPLLECGAATQAGPLAGLAVAIAGSSDDAQSSALGQRLAQLGARVHHEAWIAHEDLPAQGLRAAVATLARGDVLAVTSRRAATRLAGLKVAEGVTVAAVGPSTAEALARAGVKASLVGTQGAAALVEALLAAIPVGAGTRVLFPCAEDARPELHELLAARGAHVESLPVYRTVRSNPPPAPAVCDVRVYASASAVEAACRALPADGPRVASLALGATTARVLVEHGLAAPHAVSLDARGEPRGSNHGGLPGGVVEAVVSALVRMRADGARSDPAPA